MLRLMNGGLVALLLVFVCAEARAGSHLWRFNEVFSNADGTVQFIELKECCGSPNEILLSGKWVKSVTTGNQFDFPANLPPGSTANQHLLLATAGFAALPGAPTPDYIMRDNFFDLSQETLEYWLYSAATFSFGPGELPVDGILSLNGDGTTGVNSPTNFAGESGSIDVGNPPADFLRGDTNQDGAWEISDAIALLGFLFNGVPTTCSLAMDANDDNAADLGDAIYLLAYLFTSGASPPEPFGACGQDPMAGGPLSCVSYAACP